MSHLVRDRRSSTGRSSIRASGGHGEPSVEKFSSDDDRSVLARDVHTFLVTVMNQALTPPSFTMRASGPSIAPRGSGSAARKFRVAWRRHAERGRLQRLYSLLALFSLYVAALCAVVLISDSADIGCVLGGIAGHVLFATTRVVRSWRDAGSLEDAKARIVSLSMMG
jgi:hypothetical protein